MQETERAAKVAVMRRLALEAGAVILRIYDAPDFEVRLKSDASPVTAADEAADRLIAAGLRAAFPGAALVTEEELESQAQAAPAAFFIVDPLDGTKEFIQRRGDFTVNIAWVVAGLPVLGVVYAPAKGRLFYTSAAGGAVEETGAFDLETPGPCRPLQVAQPDNGALRAVASKSHRDQATEDFLALYAVAESRAAGSSLKFCLVASGEADFYPRIGRTMEWDTAAGDAIVRAAGGEVLDLRSGAPLTYGKPAWENPHFLVQAPGVKVRA